MEQAAMKKQLVIEVDVITGNITFSNNDEMSYGEILGAIEYTKWMVHKDWLEKEPQ